MSDLAKRLKNEYTETEWRQIVVTEWAEEDKPGIIYVKPLTMGQRKRLVLLEDNISRVLGIIEVRAKKEDGTPFFSKAELRAIELYGKDAYGPEKLGEVAGLIQADINFEDDEAEDLGKK